MSPGISNRVRILPDQGRLLISTDLHGNREDFERLCAIFFGLRKTAEDPTTIHWALLGDLVHGPSDRARERDPVRFGYLDESPWLVEAVIALRERYPDNIHVVLGNHDHGHIGGPHTSKFHADEVVALERRMSGPAIERMRGLFSEAMLALAAPCGLLLCHGSPDEQLDSLATLGAIDPSDEPDISRSSMLRSLLTSYGQRGETTATLLRQLSSPELELRVVVHGHDVDLSGWYVEHGNQACPVLFGAVPAQRRYLVVELGHRYQRAEDLREGIEVLRLYPELANSETTT
jgi:predicted phosphodiesterase